MSIPARDDVFKWLRHIGFCSIIIGALCGSLSVAAASRSTAAGASLGISGSPATSVVAGQSYGFTPSVEVPAHWRRWFTIAHKPAWASFSVSTGKLGGTPANSNTGTYSGIVISVSDGFATASLPAFAISVTGSGGSGGTGSTPTPPTISGSPQTTVTAGTSYSFQPTAKNSGGGAISFSIQDKPSWGAFSIASGALTGTPNTSQVGTYSGIVISVSNGTASASLPAFNITVTQPQSSGSGSATLSWQPPTKNTDGSALNDLAGYLIEYGTSAGALNQTVTVASPGATSSEITSLPSGTWYFGIKAYDSTGAASVVSTVVSKTIS